MYSLSLVIKYKLNDTYTYTVLKNLETLYVFQEIQNQLKAIQFTFDIRKYIITKHN